MKRPFQTYNGGKQGSGTYQQVINQIPPHRTYIEPYLGGGGVMLRKRMAQVNVGNDIDEEVYNKWVEADLPGIQLYNYRAIPFMMRWFEMNGYADTVVYLDPPYPLSSRKNPKDLYRFEMTDLQHSYLLEYVNRLAWEGVHVLISTYPNPLYQDALQGWRLISFQSTTRQGSATEWLFMNFPEPAILHEYTYIGEDYREREKIKKGVRGFMRRLAKKPVYERMAYIMAVKEMHLSCSNDKSSVSAATEEKSIRTGPHLLIVDVAGRNAVLSVSSKPIQDPTEKLSLAPGEQLAPNKSN